MKLIFFRVDNSQDYDRHTFDNVNDINVLFEMLKKLYDWEWMCYDLADVYDMKAFETDYNDEILDGGWWCITFRN